MKKVAVVGIKRGIFMREELEEFELEINLTFHETVRAHNIEEAIKKMEDKYVDGHGRLPRNLIEVYEHSWGFCQVD